MTNSIQATSLIQNPKIIYLKEVSDSIDSTIVQSTNNLIDKATMLDSSLSPAFNTLLNYLDTPLAFTTMLIFFLALTIINVFFHIRTSKELKRISDIQDNTHTLKRGATYYIPVNPKTTKKE